MGERTVRYLDSSAAAGLAGTVDAGATVGTGAATPAGAAATTGAGACEVPFPSVFTVILKSFISTLTSLTPDFFTNLIRASISFKFIFVIIGLKIQM